jgi:hypothetical protein
MRLRRNTPKTPAQRLLAGVLLVFSLALVATAERDLIERPETEIRGNKRLWQLACLNALGTLAYFRWGRAPVQTG